MKLLKEAFDFNIKDKVSVINSNYKQAKSFLTGSDVREKIEKIKAGKSSELNSNELRNYLNSIHVLNKIVQRKYKEKKGEEKSYSQQRHEDSIGILDKLGLSVSSDENLKIFKQAEAQFFKDHNDAIGKEEGEEKKEAPTETIKKDEPEEVKPSKKVETKPDEEEQDDKPVEEPEEEIDDDPKEKPEDVADKIKKMREKTSETILNVLGKVKGKAEKEKKIRDVLNTYQKKSEKLERKSLAGPKNAREAYNSAVSSSKIASLDADRVLSKGVIGRTLQGTGEAFKAGAERIKSGAIKAGQAIDRNETLKKAQNTYDKVKERVKSGVEKGLEKVGEKISTEQEKANYNLVLKYLGNEKAEEYKNSKDSALLSKALDARNKNAKIMIQKASEKARNFPQSFGKKLVGRTMERANVQRV
jgi:hypothetical protein